MLKLTPLAMRMGRSFKIQKTGAEVTANPIFGPLLILSVRRIGGKGEGIGVNSRSMAISVR